VARRESGGGFVKLRLDEETLDALWEVSYAAATDDLRPALGAVWLRDGWALATDSYRASVRPVDVFCDEPVGIPLGELPVTAPATWRSNGKALLDPARPGKQVPAWHTFTKATPHRAIFDRAELIAAVAETKVARFDGAVEPIWVFFNRGPGYTTPRVSLVTTPGQTSLRCRQFFYDGRVRNWLPLIGLDRRFLLDALRASDSPVVAVAALDPHSPVVFYDFDGDEEDGEHTDPEAGFEIVMPCLGGTNRPALRESA
jgi:hypothetical protein